MDNLRNNGKRQPILVFGSSISSEFVKSFVSGSNMTLKSKRNCETFTLILNLYGINVDCAGRRSETHHYMRAKRGIPCHRDR